MNRLAAMQDWPLFWVRAVTAVATALSRSALGITMNGSDPPSSSTAFFTCAAAVDATERPAGSEPVSVTALIRGSSMTAATSRDPISSVVNAPSGNPARVNSPSRYIADSGTFEACLSTPAFPAISAGAAKRTTCQSG